ncbi:MAG: DUF4157 domain-containing protein [Chloroflexota bacterium]
MFVHEQLDEKVEKTAVLPSPTLCPFDTPNDTQLIMSRTVVQRKRPGLPDRLRSGLEALSGLPMDDVNVHYNSPKPAQVQALAYTQGRDIYLGPKQEKHLPHEAWHVVQQKLGRVRPTTTVNELPVNDASSLEAEADRMGQRAVQMKRPAPMPDRLAAWQTKTSATADRQQHIVLYQGGQVVGGADLRPTADNAAELVNLKVNAGQRGAGGGQAILKQAAGTAQAMGKSTVRLASQDNGSGRLTGWYEKQGFKKKGVGPHGYEVLESAVFQAKAKSSHATIITKDNTSQGIYDNSLSQAAMHVAQLMEMSREDAMVALNRAVTMKIKDEDLLEWYRQHEERLKILPAHQIQNLSLEFNEENLQQRIEELLPEEIDLAREGEEEPESVRSITGVSHDIGYKVFKHHLKGTAPFRPRKGNFGQVSWFKGRGEPYIGGQAQNYVHTIEVEIDTNEIETKNEKWFELFMRTYEDENGVTLKDPNNHQKFWQAVGVELSSFPVCEVFIPKCSVNLRRTAGSFITVNDKGKERVRLATPEALATSIEVQEKVLMSLPVSCGISVRAKKPERCMEVCKKLEDILKVKYRFKLRKKRELALLAWNNNGRNEKYKKLTMELLFVNWQEAIEAYILIKEQVKILNKEEKEHDPLGGLVTVVKLRSN